MFRSCVITNPVFPVFLLSCVAQARFPRDGVSVPRCATPGNNKEHLCWKFVTSAGPNSKTPKLFTSFPNLSISYDLKEGNVPCKKLPTKDTQQRTQPVARGRVGGRQVLPCHATWSRSLPGFTPMMESACCHFGPSMFSGRVAKKMFMQAIQNPARQL